MILAIKNGKIEFSDKEKSNPRSSSGSKSISSSESDVSNNSSSMTDVSHTVQIEGCEYNKTSGSGSLGTITASCKDNSINKSFWNAYIDDNKIEGSVSFVTTGIGSTDYSFSGTRIAGSEAKKTSRETSQR
jgi:hypothetical protein